MTASFAPGVPAAPPGAADDTALAAPRPPGRRTVAHAVAAWLADDLGVDRLFTVPGEAFLPLLAAAPAAGLQIVTTRHEAGAGFAAIADARLTGRPGVAAVNRSPGAANASIAVDAARADATPLLLAVGLPCRGADPRTGFQATALAPFLGAVGRVERVDDPLALPSALASAAAALTGGRGGPVALLVPEDVWDEPVGAEDRCNTGPAERAPASTCAADHVRRAVAAAERPVVVAGRLLRVAGGPGPEVGDRLARLGERWSVPVLMANKQQDLLDNRHPAYGGHLHLGTPEATVDRLAEADLVVFLGDLPDDVHLSRWYRDQTIVVVHPEPCGPGEHVAAPPLAVLEDLTGAAGGPDVRCDERWQAAWRELEARLSTPGSRTDLSDGVDFSAVVAALDRHLPDDAVVTLDAGNFTSWVHRYLRVRRRQRLLALGGGAMGFGVPAAVAAKLRDPGRTVVAVAGDGGLLMTGNELAVARRAGAFPVVVVADNGGYGTIRAHQQRRFPGADCGTDLANPDLCAWAEAFGLPAAPIDATGDADEVLRRAIADPRGGFVRVGVSRRAVHANFDLAPVLAGAGAAPEIDEGRRRR